MADLNLLHGTVTSAASGFLGPPAPSDPENTNDGNVSTVSVSDGWGGGGGVSRIYAWMTDLGDTYEVTSFRLIAEASDMQPNYSDAEKAHTSQCYGSPDGSTWTQLDYAASPPSGFTEDVTLTFDDPAQYRYFQYRYLEETFTGFPSFPGLSIGTWVVEGEDTPVTPPAPGTPDESPYVPPPPARALLEIYVPDPEACRWGEALWGDCTWSTARWTNVTPQGVSADISWGAPRADAGILADPEAGLWTVITYDPDRILDAGNAESPYAPSIGFGLPIRLTHRGRVIRTGFVESVTYSLAEEFGEIRATDNIAQLAAVTVPSDVSLSDTLYARARDVIAATGLPITVGKTPSGGDFAVAPWEPGEFTAWFIIRQTALEALQIPYIDNVGVLRFRKWLTPLDRGSSIGSPELIDLVSFTSPDSLYSVVQAIDEAAVEVERRVTPLPRYGERVYRRTLATLDAGDWADVILEDRSLSSLRWRPGAIFPLDADSVEYLARLEIGELITMEVPEADPDVEVRARILGARVRVVDLGGQAGPDWRWFFAAATAGLEPLESDDESGATIPEYLVDDDTGEYLYPDGVVGLEG